MLTGHSVVPLALATRAAGCGTKAATLARLIGLGHRVPRGVVVTDREYRRHLAACGAHRSGQGDEALRERILKTPLGDSLRARLRQQVSGLYWPLAVRSSATAEDSGGASFAGQLDSTLNVRDQAALEAAIRTVWASPWSARCRAYAARQQLLPGALGVILQEQVDACCSGVLFTRDPLAGPGAAQAVVEYVRGLGDRLVSGAVNPSRLRIAHGDGAVEHCAGGGLPDDHARELLALGLELEQQLGGPQDVEWCHDAHGRIVVLQARPITTTAQTAAWTNANIAENFPDPVTPFLFSIVARGYSAYFRNLASGFGVSRRHLEALRPALDEIVGLHAGRLYYNLTNIHAALHLVPGGARLAKSFNTFTGARQRPSLTVPVAGPATRALGLARIAACTLWQYLFIGRRVARFEARADAFAARLERDALTTRGAAELACDLDAFLDLRLRRWNDAALADAAAMVTYAALERLVTRAATAGGAQALQNDLLKGLPGLASARPVAELWALARAVRSDPQLRRLFAAHTADALAARLHTPELRAFGARFRAYLERWGFRYSGELMLTSPTPEEHPAPMLAILQSYLKDDGPGPEAISARQTRARLEATAALSARLARPAAWLLLAVLRATQGAIRLRERARMKQALVYTRLRRLTLRIGDVLAARGVVALPGDVFYLTVDEVRHALAHGNSTDTAALRADVAARRAELLAGAPQRPPDSFVLARGARWRPAPGSVAQRASGPEAALHGTSACGGTTEGAARVIEDVAAIGAFRAGEILVTRQTDPGWAAVFFMVKGLVVERGGMLSHGAIIAREYGIPAVVGVDDATSHIRSGQRIRVDGDHGLVELAAS